MADRETGDDRKKWHSVMPHCKKHNTVLDILNIYFSTERDATRIDVECSACDEKSVLLYVVVMGSIILVSRMHAEEANVEEWQILPSLHCENLTSELVACENGLAICANRLVVQDICVSDNGDLLFEYECFACGDDKIRDLEFPRDKRISWAIAVHEFVKRKELVSDEAWRGQPVFTASGARINVLPARPN